MVKKITVLAVHFPTVDLLAQMHGYSLHTDFGCSLKLWLSIAKSILDKNMTSEFRVQFGCLIIAF